jgi:hypothetical protein
MDPGWPSRGIVMYGWRQTRITARQSYQASRRQRGLNGADHARDSVLDPDFGIQILGQAALDEPRPEPFSEWRRDQRTILLLPPQEQTRRAHRPVAQPGQADLPAPIGQGSVLGRIRRQLVQSHRKRQSKPRRHLDLRPSDLEAGLPSDTVGFEDLLDDVVQARALQFSRVRTLCTRESPSRRLSIASLAASGVGAVRKVWEAIDCTVARVFFTRWFSSLISRC